MFAVMTNAHTALVEVDAGFVGRENCVKWIESLISLENSFVIHAQWENEQGNSSCNEHPVRGRCECLCLSYADSELMSSSKQIVKSE